jgi:histidine ammonia-lyase
MISSMKRIDIDGASLSIAEVAAVANRQAEAVLPEETKQRIVRSRGVVDTMVREDRTVYGITTGFGVFSDVRISSDRVRELQRNLVLSHCAGVGEPYSPEVVRAMMLLRANALAKGFSGIRLAVVERLVEMLRRDLLPVIPSQGSVGASGDLAPLAHLAAALMGEGRVLAKGAVKPAREVLEEAGLEPVVYEAKEGLAMINGTQAITAMGSLALERSRRLLDWADVVAAMSIDALLGTDAAFDERIQQARPHPGQIAVARRMRALLRESELRESHRGCGRVQDAYSLRCIPQVHGAVRDAIAYAESKLEIEINSATDNPLVFPAESDILSGGNFHGAPVAMACDFATIAMTDLSSISERRVERLVNPQLSGLPGFLVEEGGLNSGFMIAQVTAAALVSESRALSHPASVDSIPTSANKEDHVSMGPTAAWKFDRVSRNTSLVVAIEALCAAQAIDFRRPLRSSDAIERLHARIRERVPRLENDRFLHDDIESVREIIETTEADDGILSGY